MTRNRASAKAAGSWLERAVADHIAEQLGDDGVDRQVKTGRYDKGDIRGVKSLTGDRLVIECKEYGGKIQAGPWMDEARIEAGNADAAAAFVVAKRLGTRKPGEQWVITTVDDLLVLLGGKPS
jgi:hypothetical protein